MLKAGGSNMRRGRFIGRGGKGLGPGGVCRCPNCGYTEPHKTGIPCFTRKCPRCGTRLVR